MSLLPTDIWPFVRGGGLDVAQNSLALSRLMAQCRHADQHQGVYYSIVDQFGSQEAADRAVSGFTEYRRVLGPAISELAEMCQLAMRALNAALEDGAITEDEYWAALPKVERSGMAGVFDLLSDLAVVVASAAVAVAIAVYLPAAFAALGASVAARLASLFALSAGVIAAAAAVGAVVPPLVSVVTPAVSVAGGAALVIGALALLAFARSRSRAA